MLIRVLKHLLANPTKHQANGRVARISAFIEVDGEYVYYHVDDNNAAMDQTGYDLCFAKHGGLFAQRYLLQTWGGDLLGTAVASSLFGNRFTMKLRRTLLEDALSNNPRP